MSHRKCSISLKKRPLVLIREVCIMGYVTNTKFYLHKGRGGGGGEAQVIM